MEIFWLASLIRNLTDSISQILSVCFLIYFVSVVP